MRCHCGHTDDGHLATIPYACRTCPCPAYRWDIFPLETWNYWSGSPHGRTEWHETGGVPA